VKRACNDLEAALGMVREELNRVRQIACNAGAEAFRQGDMESADEAKRQLKALQGVQDRFEAFCDDVRKLAGHTKPAGQGQDGPPRRPPRGMLLEERAYVLPILRTLEQAGGSAPKAEVLAALHVGLKDRLTTSDLGHLADGQVRWHNRAVWVRNYMADAGLISRRSPRGLWEITDAGRECCAAGDTEATWRTMMDAKKARRVGVAPPA